MKSNSQLPTIESIEKEFDKKFMAFPEKGEKMFAYFVDAQEAKSFFCQKLTEILEGLINDEEILEYLRNPNCLGLRVKLREKIDKLLK